MSKILNCVGVRIRLNKSLVLDPLIIVERKLCVEAMGISSQPSLVSISLTNLLEGSEEHRKSSSYEYLWNKVLEGGKVRKKSVQYKRPRRTLMKRRVGSRRGVKGIQRKVRTLKRLVPNSESLELDGLFRETTDYILALQTRVRIMQVMVNVLKGSDE
ncbi:unnamed protein product [Lupinus luteus]|uniref:BHLH domain-containing protein n=1 Tax=Lupinus luteus TaxID=3873 RepID=A0AAV1VUX9_LUPLU